MIKVEEVRYDNLIRSHLTQEIIKVDWLVIKHLSDGNVQSVYDPQKPVYEPIKISEEWLQKLGFEMRMINGIIPEWCIMCTPPNYKRQYALAFRFGMLISTAPGACDDQKWYPWIDSGTAHNFNIQSIHELQNLYYAITGKELAIVE